MNHNRQESRNEEHSSRMPYNQNFNQHQRPMNNHIPYVYGQQYISWPNQFNYRQMPTIMTPHFQHQHHQQALHPPPQYLAAKQLFNRIQQAHLTYLFRDVGIEEGEIRGKLEHMIEEYLSLVPQHDKFQLTATAHCFRKTIYRTNFNPSKSIAAFSAIERYASNLLNYPWREEFKTIHAYNGFFFKTIDFALEDYDRIMHSMGFQFQEDYVFTLKDNSFDPDQVTRVSLDCLIAIVLIRQMLRIYEQIPKSTFQQIFEVLDQYIFDTETAIQFLSQVDNTNQRKLIDFDSPDFSMQRPSRLPVSLNNDYIISPPNGYSETDLDSIEYIDKSPGTTVKSSTSYPQLKASSSKSSLKAATKSKLIDIDDRLAHEIEQLQLGKGRNGRNRVEKKIPMNSREHQVRNDSSPISNSKFPKVRQWTCKWCSIENGYNHDICKVCSKSRLPANESTPLESGGKYCPTCTLVNDRNHDYCRVCRRNLDNAPTYI